MAASALEAGDAIVSAMAMRGPSLAWILQQRGKSRNAVAARSVQKEKKRGGEEGPPRFSLREETLAFARYV
jgi:hypothetical protein